MTREILFAAAILAFAVAWGAAVRVPGTCHNVDPCGAPGVWR